jgi:superfamily I DNA and RNA helicase
VDLDANLKAKAGSLLRIQTFEEAQAEGEWVAAQVAADIRQGLLPTDILITALTGEDEDAYLAGLESCLKATGVSCWRPGFERGSTDFRREGCVTLAKIFEAKGNEAWKVYVTRFHWATRPIGWRGEDELHKRNQAFVALTRTRLWCVVTGKDGPIFEELRTAIEQSPELAFPAFRRPLKRVTDDTD